MVYTSAAGHPRQGLRTPPAAGVRPVQCSASFRTTRSAGRRTFVSAGHAGGVFTCVRAAGVSLAVCRSKRHAGTHRTTHGQCAVQGERLLVRTTPRRSPVGAGGLLALLTNVIEQGQASTHSANRSECRRPPDHPSWIASATRAGCLKRLSDEQSGDAAMACLDAVSAACWLVAWSRRRLLRHGFLLQFG
jgi:hypothetical protein